LRFQRIVRKCHADNARGRRDERVLEAVPGVRTSSARRSLRTIAGRPGGRQGKPWPVATGQIVMAANLVGAMTVRLSQCVGFVDSALERLDFDVVVGPPENVERCKERLRKATTLTPGGSTARHAPCAFHPRWRTMMQGPMR
jgi:hypothetical protein